MSTDCLPIANVPQKIAMKISTIDVPVGVGGDPDPSEVYKFYVIPNQIIITGLSADISTLIDRLNLLYGYMLIDKTNPLATIRNIFGTIGAALGDYRLFLYELLPNGTVEPPNPWEVVENAHDIAMGFSPVLFAVAEVNEILHCQPHTAGGGVNGGPTGDALNIPTSERDDAPFFRTQWAFQPGTGINLFDGSNYIDGQAHGENVHVAIFDSSPLGTGTYDTQTRTAGFPFRLCVTAAMEDAIGDSVVSGRFPVRDEYSEHGYFVASLIHAVAPLCHIHLVQVLDDHVHGSFGFLITMLDNYLDSFRAAHSGDPNARLIINLSLGFKINALSDLEKLKDHKAQARQVYQKLRQLLRRLPSQRGDSDEQPIFNEYFVFRESEGGIPRLAGRIYYEAMSARHPDIKHLIVAAAGNQGAKSNFRPEARMPASFDSVLGVAAAGKGRNLALFANRGKVLAPGGDYNLRANGGSPDSSVAVWEDDLAVLCYGQETDCSHAIVGRATIESNIPADGSAVGTVQHQMDTGYMLWWGSSFAAPMASGLAALVWGDSVRSDLSSDQVRELIINNTAGGIIDVQNTLGAARAHP